MLYSAHVLRLIEDALCECENYHNALDKFLLRCQVPKQLLEKARNSAEIRYKAKNPEGGRASKRYVIQDLMELINAASNPNALYASLVTGLIKDKFPSATLQALAAIESLRSEIDLNKQAKKEALEEEERFKKQQAEQEDRKRDKIISQKISNKKQLEDDFMSLIKQDNPQARGFAFEKFLNKYFEFEGLKPRNAFKITGEQIDGSFSWNGKTFLVEAKWQQAPVSGKEFSSLIYKIEGKTADTRGLFISVNGYSQEALQGLKSKGSLKFVGIDGAHIMGNLSSMDSLKDLLDKVWRHADETGEAYLPAMFMSS